jgi:sodium/bile acid cotransporter 7
MLQLIRNYWFLFGLGFSFTAGLAGYRWLLPVAELSWLMTLIVFAVMAMMAAPVPLEMVRQNLTRPWPALLASLINLALVPALGWIGSRWLHHDLGGGLIVAMAVPSTLTSAAVMARKAGGDETVSIMTTLITNVLCVLVTPLWIIMLLGVSVQLSMLDMVTNLCIVVLLPIFLVQLARMSSRSFCYWAERSRLRLSVYCQLGILSMVLIGSVQMGARWLGPQSDSLEATRNPISWINILAVLLIGIAIHVLALAVCWIAARRCGMPPTKSIAASFSASQKTLMIGLNLAIHCGVNILPMVTYHICQLFIDAIIAEKWLEKTCHYRQHEDSSSESSSS